MKIYTKTGDMGETSLVGGKRVSKSSARVNAYGDIDELISYIGLLRCHVEECDGELRRIQKALMTVSAHVASDVSNPRLTPFSPDETVFLENEIDRMTKEVPSLTCFVLPARPAQASECHIARCVCRRAERACVGIGDSRPEMVEAARYLNRLSDYLFTLARWICVHNNISEDFWSD